MNHAYVLLSIVLLAAPGSGDAGAEGEGSEVTVPLRGARPQGDDRLGYSSPRKMEIESTVPRFLFEVPEFQSEAPLFFRVSLGETKGVPFYGALDKDAAALYHTRLYLDRNRDLDLTNDGDPIEARVRTLWTTKGKVVEFLDLQLDLPYVVDGKETTEPYACVFYYVLEPGQKEPTAMLVERDGWREGTLTVGGETYRLALVDDDSDGQYSTSDSWVMKPGTGARKELLHRDVTRSMLFPAWSEDQDWTVEVKRVDPAGRTATFAVVPAKETERDFFLRIALQRQTAEEKSLNLDPLRPKADAAEKVDWIENKDVKYALDIARSPRVRKRLLIEFSARTCPWCLRMDKYTFRDREVVALSKRFVCARIRKQTPAQLKASGDAKKFKVEGTPTYVVLDLNGAEIARHESFSRPTEFAAWLKSALR